MATTRAGSAILDKDAARALASVMGPASPSLATGDGQHLTLAKHSSYSAAGGVQ